MRIQENQPDLWRHLLPVPQPDGHKYHRGHVAIFAAEELTGATRLAASACSRIGAGLVSVVATCRQDVYRTCLPADIMVQSEIPAKATVVLGGSGGITKQQNQELLDSSDLHARVFDADALPSPDRFDGLNSSCILTPHRGEFERVFGPIEDEPPVAALEAAHRCGAVVVLKGPATFIASPDGEVVKNTHASPYLAKAGTGDVLAGLIAGLAGQGMAPFWASCAGVWIHGEAGRRLGPGMVASDIGEKMPEILTDLLLPA